MPIVVRKAQADAENIAAAAHAGSLAQAAVDLLHAAAGVAPNDPEGTVEERNIWQPDFWLMQRCWQALADLGAGDEALAVAALLELRHPLAPVQALHRVAQQAERFPALQPLVAHEMARLSPKLFSPWIVSDQERQTERLLLAAAAAARIRDDAGGAGLPGAAGPDAARLGSRGAEPRTARSVGADHCPRGAVAAHKPSDRRRHSPL